LQHSGMLHLNFDFLKYSINWPKMIF
jgi:hypothetical protein